MDATLDRDLLSEDAPAPASLSRVGHLLDRSIFYGVLIVIALTAIPYGTVQPWSIALFECLIFAITILAVVDALVSQKPGVPLVRLTPVIALLVFVLVQSAPIFSSSGPVAVRTAISADPFGTRQLAIRLLVFALAGLLLLRYASSRERLRMLIYLVIGISVASACFGLMRRSLQTGPGFLLPALQSGSGFAQFINRNHFSFLIEMSLGLSLGLIVGEVRRYRRVLALILLSALMWVALIYSNSRGGIIASLCQFLFLAVLIDPVRRLTARRAETNWSRFQKLVGGVVVRIFLIASLVAVFAYGVGWVGGEQVVTNFEQADTAFDQPGLDIRVNTRRKQIWASTWQLIKANPIAGVGFGGYWIGITKYHDASGTSTPQEAHNDYLELLASGGLIGAALVAVFIVIFLKRARRNLHSRDPFRRAACLGALTGIFGVAVHSFVDFGLHITINALVFGVLIIIAVARPHDPLVRGELTV